MRSRDTLAYFENLNISKSKQDSEKMKTPFWFIWKSCSDVFTIGSTLFSSQWLSNNVYAF